MEFIKIDKNEFDFIFSQMELNFILEERRDFLPAKCLLDVQEYTLFHIVNKGEKVGFISVWSLGEFFFIEHFVVYENFRNLGYGSLALNLAKAKWGNLVLECELPNTEMAKRRMDFYKRNEFCQNKGKYYQPPYREGGKGVYLALMSYPTLLSDFNKTTDIIHKRVYNK